MSNVHKPAGAGKDSDPSDDNEDALDFLVSFYDHLTENLPRIRAACARFDAKVRAQRALEEAESDDEAPLTEPDPAHVPGLARLSNGRLALATVHLDAASIEGRATWTGVVLTEAEACDALDRVSDAADEAAGHVAGRILANAKKRREEGEDDE